MNKPASSSPDIKYETPGHSERRATSKRDKDQRPVLETYLIIIVVTLVQFVTMLDLSIVTTAIPRITDQFDSLLDVGWYGSAYSLASAALQPLTGKFYTYFRVKVSELKRGIYRLPCALTVLLWWTYMVFIFIFELGSLLCAVATSSTMLIVARAIAGLGGAGLINGGLTIISAVLPKHKRPSAMGICISIGQLGQAMGPLVGGAFTQFVTWRWCFYINLPIGGLVLLFLNFLDVPDAFERPDTETTMRNLVKHMDTLGFVIFAPAAIMFFLALQYGGNQYSWNSSTVIGLLCGAGVTILLFFAWEHHKGDEAMIPLPMLWNRVVWSSCITMLFVTSVLTCGAYYLPIYFQAVLGASPIMSGVYYLPNILLQIAFAMLSGIMVQKLGFYLPWVLAGTALASLGYGLLSMLTPVYSVAHRVGFQIIAGAGLGSAAAMPFIAVQNLVPQTQLPLAMAVLVFCLNFGAATFLTLAETDFSQSLVHELKHYAPDVNSTQILSVGATAFRGIVSEADLPGVLRAYSASVDNVFYLIAGSGVAAFVFAWGMGWEDIRKHKPRLQTEGAEP